MDMSCGSHPDYCRTVYSCSMAHSSGVCIGYGSAPVLREGYPFLQKTGEPVYVLPGSNLFCSVEYISDFQIYPDWKTALGPAVSFSGVSSTAFHRGNSHGIHYTQVVDLSV